MKPIVLIGFMGCGKSSLGKRTAHLLDLEFYDLDLEIEKRYRVNISGLFQKYGEGVFRKLESDSLLQFLESENVLLSLGGGTPCYQGNIEHILNKAFSVYIQLSPKSLFYRLRASKKPRPLIQGMNDNELQTFISQRLEERKIFYDQADLVIKGEGLTPKILAERIREEIG